MIELKDPITYMKLKNEPALIRYPLGAIPYPKSMIAETQKVSRSPYVYPTVNCLDEMFKDYTVNQRVNFNMKGGGNVAPIIWQLLLQ